MTALSPITAAVEALRAGGIVIVVDDESRENEGDAIISAALATPETVGWMVRHTSGYLCAPMPSELADRLELPPMVAHNEDSRQTAYSISVDALEGTTTGISATDRARTLTVLADPATTPAQLIRPGHILPLRARDGGVRERPGHTEAGVDLMLLAGLPPIAAIGEIVGDDGELLRLAELLEMGERDDLPVISIADLVTYLDEHSADAAPASLPAPPVAEVEFVVETLLPTSHGLLRVRAYRDALTGSEHLALIGEPSEPAATTSTDPLVRVHSECLTGEAFGSLTCECGPQLAASLDRVAAEGGVVIYLRGQEGRGIGLINKLRAYRLQSEGLDTLEANLALGLPADARDYSAAAAIARDLGIERLRLLSNNPDKRRQLERHGITVTALEPLVVGVQPRNADYLATKRDRMGHTLPADLIGRAGRASSRLNPLEPPARTENPA